MTKVKMLARHLDFDVLPILGFFIKFQDCTHKIASNKKGVPIIRSLFGSDDNSLLDSKTYFYYDGYNILKKSSDSGALSKNYIHRRQFAEELIMPI
jgi:hypothetical protein